MDEENFVGIGDGIQPVRDDDLYGGRRKLIQDLLELLFGDGVDIRSGFVEDQELRISKHGAHECNQLLLSKTDGIAHGHDFRLKSLFESREQTSNIPLVQQSHQLIIGLVPVLFVSIEDVVPNSARKQERFLEDESDFPGALVRFIRSNVPAVQQYTAG